MTLYEITDDGVRDVIRVAGTNTGKGIFAVRDYPATAVIGEIRGTLIRDRPYGSAYSFDLEDGLQLEPYEPFRFVNHSCDPNCEFDWLDERYEGEPPTRRVYLSAYRNIVAGEQLTIDYNWPASVAIPCDCRSPLCRGWVVAPDELGRVSRTVSDRLQTDVQGDSPPLGACRGGPHTGT